MNSAVRRRPAGIAVRPVQPRDLALFDRLWQRLSPESIFRRFHCPIAELPLALKQRLVTVDHHDRDALVALIGGEVVGVARYARSPESRTVAEIAVLVEDVWQDRGIGKRLLCDVAILATRRGVLSFTGEVQADNHRMLHIIRTLTPEATLTRYGASYRVRAHHHPAPTAASSLVS